MFSKEGPEIPSGSVVVSEADGDAKSHKPGTASVQQDRSVKGAICKNLIE